VTMPRRILLAFALWPLLLPGTLALALGLHRLAGEKSAAGFSGRAKYGLLWLAVPAASCLAFRWFVAGHHPLFIVPAALMGLSFIFPLPLWLLADRQGMSLARGVSHAGALAFVLAYHLPFVQC